MHKHTTQKRLIYSLAIVVAWLSFVVEGSHALLTDGAELTGNTLNTTGVDLQISNSQNASSTIFTDSRPGFAYSLSPGQKDEKFILLKNVTSGDVKLDVGVGSVVQSVEPELANSTSLEFTPVDGSGAATGPGITRTLADLSVHPLANLGFVIDKGTTQRVKIRVGLDQNYALQNQTLSYDLVFTGIQHYVP